MLMAFPTRRTPLPRFYRPTSPRLLDGRAHLFTDLLSIKLCQTPTDSTAARGWESPSLHLVSLELDTSSNPTAIVEWECPSLQSASLQPYHTAEWYSPFLHNGSFLFFGTQNAHIFIASFSRTTRYRRLLDGRAHLFMALFSSFATLQLTQLQLGGGRAHLFTLSLLSLFATTTRCGSSCSHPIRSELACSRYTQAEPASSPYRTPLIGSMATVFHIAKLLTTLMLLEIEAVLGRADRIADMLLVLGRLIPRTLTNLLLATHLLLDAISERLPDALHHPFNSRTAFGASRRLTISDVSVDLIGCDPKPVSVSGGKVECYNPKAGGHVLDIRGEPCTIFSTSMHPHFTLGLSSTSRD